MKITELTESNLENNLGFDLIDDVVAFMQNDPQFYRKRYFPACAKLADVHNEGSDMNNTSVLGSMVDRGINAYCKTYNLARKPADLFTLEDRQAIIDRVASEELERIKQGEYQ